MYVEGKLQYHFFFPANWQFFLRPQTTWYFFSVQVNLEKPLNSFHTNYTILVLIWVGHGGIR